MRETRKLSTILFADIVGYTSIMQKNEGIAMKYLQTFKQILEQTVSYFNGSIVQYYGDGCLLTFDSTTSGVKCAIALQNEFIKKELSVRIGVHLGEVVFAENNVFGDGVNIASRIESMGIPGSVLISSSIRHQIKNKDEFELQSLGTFEFKNVTEPMEVYALENHGLKVPDKTKIQGKFKQAKTRSNRWSLALGSIILLGILAISVYSYMVDDGKVTFKKNPSIAVTPLLNFDKVDSLNYLVDGITREITKELALIKSLNITPNTMVLPYKNKKKTQDQIADELEVDYLISGGVRFFNNYKSVDITIELFDPFNKKLIWHHTLKGKVNNAENINLKVAHKLADDLGISLSEQEKKDIEESITENGEAFKLFLKAKEEHHKMSPSGFKNAERHLKKALELDPEFGEAYSFLAWNYAVGGSSDLVPNSLSSKESYSLAKPKLDTAMELDPESSDNYIIKAFLNLYLLNKIKDAKIDVDRALSKDSWFLTPINSCICTGVSTYLALNDLEKAKTVALKAQEIDPEHAFYYWDLGNIAMKEGDYKEAQEHYLKAVEKADHSLFNSYLAWSYYYNGQFKEALNYLNKANNSDEIVPRFSVTVLSLIYLKMGDQKSSDKYLKELLDRLAGGELHLNLNIAYIYLERNNIDQTLNYLEKGLEESDFGFAVFLSLIPKFEVLKDEPRFQKILTEIQSPGI